MLNKNFALAHSPSAFSLWCAREPFFSLIRCFDRKVCNLLWIWCSSALNICFPLVEYVHSTRATNGNFSDSIKTMNNTIISISLVVCYMVPHRKNTRDQLTWRMQMSYSVSQSNIHIYISQLKAKPAYKARDAKLNENETSNAKALGEKAFQQTFQQSLRLSNVPWHMQYWILFKSIGIRSISMQVSLFNLAIIFGNGIFQVSPSNRLNFLISSHTVAHFMCISDHIYCKLYSLVLTQNLAFFQPPTAAT